MAAQIDTIQLTGSPLDSRSIEMDALRGFAVLGILAMNIIDFGLPANAYIAPGLAGTGPASAGDIAAWIGAFLLFDGKMRGLFSLLFGASMMLIAERSERAGMTGGSAATIHYRRMGWLALFGLAHYFLLWRGDILFLYAVIGSVAFTMRKAETRSLIIAALCIYGGGFLLLWLAMAPLLLAQSVGTAPGASAAAVAHLEDVLAGFSDGLARQDIALYQSGYADILRFRLADWQRLFSVLFNSAFETFPLMLLGMALMRSGFMTGAWSPRQYRLMVAALFVPGFALYVLLAWADVRSGFDPILSLNIVAAWSLLPRLMMSLGYAALLMLAIRAGQGTAIIARVAAAGRAAFSNYLGTSLVMTTLFYGYGFGLFAQVPRPMLYFFVLGMGAFMLLWSKPWLDRYRYGPLEWLWRSLARGRPQPIRR